MAGFFSTQFMLHCLFLLYILLLLRSVQISSDCNFFLSFLKKKKPCQDVCECDSLRAKLNLFFKQTFRYIIYML